jgi:hypothetical protein
MSDTFRVIETEVEKPAEPKKKGGWPKGRKRRKKAARAVPFKAPEEFAGMTALECLDGCKANLAAGKPCCLLSEKNVCIHPMKSGITPELMGNPRVLARYMRAKKALAHQKIDLRGG